MSSIYTMTTHGELCRSWNKAFIMVAGELDMPKNMTKLVQTGRESRRDWYSSKCHLPLGIPLSDTNVVITHRTSSLVETRTPRSFWITSWITEGKWIVVFYDDVVEFVIILDRDVDFQPSS